MGSRAKKKIFKRGHNHSKKVKALSGTISRINKTFGFATLDEDNTEVFIPGKFLRGALKGDKVLLKTKTSEKKSLEGEVVKILKRSDAQMTGVLVERQGKMYVQPGDFTNSEILVIGGLHHTYKSGDKVLISIAKRGKSHDSHKAEIVSNYGTSASAEACSTAYIEAENVPIIFSDEIIEEATNLKLEKISKREIENRLDLRNDVIFTIDGADSKDLDDAVSIKRMGDFYELGVHIADVSYFIRPDTLIDEEAFKRGTSIYYANKVIPMLPKEISNGICSLNPNEDRLTFSAIIVLDNEGNLKDFSFKKSIINSRVKGIYSEINQIIENNASLEIQDKYKQLVPTINLMKELSDKLEAKKRNRGATEIVTNESKIIFNENQEIIDVKKRERGQSEQIIEEFMLIANQAAATLARIAEIPFVYRIHDVPSLEKIEELKTVLTQLGLSTRELDGKVSATNFSSVLKKAKDTPFFDVINKIVLRSMSKAKYSEVETGHFGLALEDYSHFTSPIRRYPDLAIHRILNDFVQGVPKKQLFKKYDIFTREVGVSSSQCEIRAMKIERECEDYYKAEYMAKHIGEKYSAVVSSVVNNGIYVMLENTIEGLVKIIDLPEGHYEFDGIMCLKNIKTGDKYQIGDKVEVECINADVNSGRIDFKIIWHIATNYDKIKQKRSFIYD